MTNFFAWSLLVLGALHVLYGAVKFRRPLADAFSYTPQVREISTLYGWWVLICQ
jgi:hypothetical protein